MLQYLGTHFSNYESKKRSYLEVLELVTVEVTADADALGADDDDLLTIQDGFSNNGSKTAQKVASPVNDDWLENDTNV